MTSTYSEDLRERIVRSVDTGASRRSTARKFDVSVSFVIKLLRRWRMAGTLAAFGGSRSPWPLGLVCAMAGLPWVANGAGPNEGGTGV